MTELDLSELEEATAPTDQELNKIAELARSQKAAELRVEQLTAELSQAKEGLRKISQDLLPDAMKAVGMKEFTLESGETITIKDEVYANIANKNFVEAANWLRANNHGAILKNQFNMTFGAGEDHEAAQLVTFLDANGYDFNRRLNVHPGTLKRWVKDQLAEGKPIPEAITYYEFRESKIK